MKQRIKDEVDRLRSIASGLSYNNDASEGNLKHILYEVAMRLETGWYDKGNNLKFPNHCYESLKETFVNIPCNHPEHNFPMMLHIPSGQSYTHVCPGCGYSITVAGEPISL